MEPDHPDWPPAQGEVPEASEQAEARSCRDRAVAGEGEVQPAAAEGTAIAGRTAEAEGPRPVSTRLREGALARDPRGGLRLHKGP